MRCDPGRPSRRGLVALAVVVTALVAGVLLARSSGGARSTPGSEKAASRVQKSASSSLDPRPAGDAPDQSGAALAGVDYAAASQRWLYLTDEQIRTEVADVATPGSAKRLSDDVVADVSMVRPQLAGADGRVWWVVRPLAWRIDRFDGSDARVAVWVITILSASGIASPQSEFVTVTLDLEWVDGRWRVSDVGDRAGPTPMTGAKDQPWDAEPFDHALDGFTRIDAGSDR